MEWVCLETKNRVQLQLANLKPTDPSRDLGFILEFEILTGTLNQ